MLRETAKAQPAPPSKQPLFGKSGAKTFFYLEPGSFNIFGPD